MSWMGSLKIANIGRHTKKYITDMSKKANAWLRDCRILVKLVSKKPRKTSKTKEISHVVRTSNINAEDELISFMKSSLVWTFHKSCLTISLPLEIIIITSTNFLRLLKKMHTWNAADARGGGGVPTQKVRTRCAR